MNWDKLETHLSIVLTIVFFILKDVVPYFYTLYDNFRRETYSEELLTDLNKELFTSFIHFPCEIIELSIGFLLGKVIFCSKAASIVSVAEVQETLVYELGNSTFWFYISLLLLFPLWFILCNLFHSMIWGKKRTKKVRSAGICLCVLQYVMTGLVLWCSLR